MNFAIKFGIPVLFLVGGFAAVFIYSVIPYLTDSMNQMILTPIIYTNIIISIALFLLLYVYNEDFQSNIIQIATVCTFLVALPITLFSMATSSIMYSN
jgi:hypothetical protein